MVFYFVFNRSKRRRDDPEFGKKKFGSKRSNQRKKSNFKKNVSKGFQWGKMSGGGGGMRCGKRRYNKLYQLNIVVSRF